MVPLLCSRLNASKCVRDVLDPRLLPDRIPQVEDGRVRMAVVSGQSNNYFPRNLGRFHDFKMMVEQYANEPIELLGVEASDSGESSRAIVLSHATRFDLVLLSIWISTIESLRGLGAQRQVERLRC